MAKVLKWPQQVKPVPKTEAEIKPRSGILGFILNLFNSRDENIRGDKGLAGEVKVANELGTKLSERWVIINDYKLSLGNTRTQIDHLVIGPPGLFSLETKNWNSAACDEQGQWYRYHNRMWVPQKSPVEQNQVKIKEFTAVCSKIVPGLQVQGIIVFANPGKFDFTKAKITGNTKVIGIYGLVEYLCTLEGDSPILRQEQIDDLVNLLYPKL